GSLRGAQVPAPAAVCSDLRVAPGRVCPGTPVRGAADPVRSEDLAMTIAQLAPVAAPPASRSLAVAAWLARRLILAASALLLPALLLALRSEERRVGKDGRSWSWPDD